MKLVGGKRQGQEGSLVKMDGLNKTCIVIFFLLFYSFCVTFSLLESVAKSWCPVINRAEAYEIVQWETSPFLYSRRSVWSFPHSIPSAKMKDRCAVRCKRMGGRGRIYQLDCGEWWRGCAVAIFNCTITQADLPSLALSSNKQLWSIILQIEIRKNKYFPPAGGESTICKSLCHRLAEVTAHSCGARYWRSRMYVKTCLHNLLLCPFSPTSGLKSKCQM